VVCPSVNKCCCGGGNTDCVNNAMVDYPHWSTNPLITREATFIQLLIGYRISGESVDKVNGDGKRCRTIKSEAQGKTSPED